MKELIEISELPSGNVEDEVGGFCIDKVPIPLTNDFIPDDANVTLVEFVPDPFLSAIPSIGKRLSLESPTANNFLCGSTLLLSPLFPTVQLF